MVLAVITLVSSVSSVTSRLGASPGSRGRGHRTICLLFTHSFNECLLRVFCDPGLAGSRARRCETSCVALNLLGQVDVYLPIS